MKLETWEKRYLIFAVSVILIIAVADLITGRPIWG